MKQGEIWLTNLNPTPGSEQAGTRPVLIISGNLLNQYAEVVICVPLTTIIKKYHGNLIVEPNHINGLSEKSEVLTLHIRSISKTRLIKRLGKISTEEIRKVLTCVSEILTY